MSGTPQIAPVPPAPDPAETLRLAVALACRLADAAVVASGSPASQRWLAVRHHLGGLEHDGARRMTDAVADTPAANPAGFRDLTRLETMWLAACVSAAVASRSGDAGQKARADGVASMIEGTAPAKIAALQQEIMDAGDRAWQAPI